MLETIVSVLAFALITYAPHLITRLKERLKKSAKSFSRNVEARAKIAELVKEIRIRTEANRVAIFEYSNSEKAVNGIPFDYVSITYEDTDNHTVKIASEFKKLPIGRFASQLRRIDQSDKFVIEKDDDPDEEIAFNLKQYGVKMNYHFKITGHLRDGVLSVTHTSETDPYDEELIEFIRLRCRLISEQMLKLK